MNTQFNILRQQNSLILNNFRLFSEANRRPNNKLYIADIPQDVTEEQLVDVFTQMEFAPQDVKFIDSKQFTAKDGTQVELPKRAWIQFDSVQQAQDALAKCNGTFQVGAHDISCVLSLNKERITADTTK